MELIPLCTLAFFAGFIDSVVGGGGLIQVPALFLLLPGSLGQSVGLVFGTNKLSSICGTGMAMVQYTLRIPIPWGTILPAGLTAMVFALFGAMAVSSLDKAIMKPIIFILLISVAAYTWMKKDLGRWHAPQFSPARERLAGLMVGAGIGFYDGFFGPGTGSFLMFIFTGLFGFDFLAATACTKVINFATNVSAVGYFAATDNILYLYGLPMGLCNMLGAILGSRLAMLKGNTFIRGFFLCVAGGMILRFGYDLIR